MKNIKIFVPVVVIILIAIVACAYFGHRNFFDKTNRQNFGYIGASTERTNWAVYKNKKFGFEFEYPRDWYLLQTDEYVLVTDYPGKPETDMPWNGFTVFFNNTNSCQESTWQAGGMGVESKSVCLNDSLSIFMHAVNDDLWNGRMKPTIEEIYSAFETVNK